MAAVQFISTAVSSIGPAKNPVGAIVLLSVIGFLVAIGGSCGSVAHPIMEVAARVIEASIDFMIDLAEENWVDCTLCWLA